MEKQYQVTEVGIIRVDEGGYRIELSSAYRDVLKGLEGFSYINIVWWFSGCDNEQDRSQLTEVQPYHKGPKEMGVFATRSPLRPNPIALTAEYVTYLDIENGIVGLAYIDAFDHSPVLDIKPYTPSLDRVASPCVPTWCAHWPSDVETSGDFDWESEFNF